MTRKDKKVKNTSGAAAPAVDTRSFWERNEASDGVLLTEDVFWYARAAVNNEKDSAINNQITGGLTIPYQLPAQEIDNSLNSNYAKYAERAKIYSSDSVRSFFRKGIFGAYVTAMEPLED